jgi:NCAIR mutase (PurE)-related protein
VSSTGPEGGAEPGGDGAAAAGVGAAVGAGNPDACAADGVIDGLVTLDLDRARRRGAPEAVLCDGKTVEQVAAIAREYARLIAERAEDQASDDGAAPLGPILFTRADGDRARAVLAALPDAHHDPEARLLAWPPQPPAPTGGLVIVACAGTSDLPVAREALLTAQHLGRPARLIADIGIAGLHRLQARLPELREAACVVVAAGMDGALPTVVAGQIAAPVVALPTSVGYGVAAGGVTAALTMLSGCAPGIGVVNIDNGYGAGHLAAQIARWAPGPDLAAD